MSFSQTPGAKKSTITHWANGRRKGPSFRLLSRIAARVFEGIPAKCIEGRFAGMGAKADIAAAIHRASFQASHFYSPVEVLQEFIPA